MYTRYSALLSVAAFAAVAAAMPSVLEARGSSQCDTGPIYCCNSVTTANDPAAAQLIGLLNIVVGDINALVGLGCSGITVIGAGSGSECAQQPICCTDVYQNGLINLGCTPVNINL